MKLASRLLLVSGLLVATLSTAACSSSEDTAAVSEDDLTSSMGTGTYVVDSRAWGSYYATRITFASGKKYEAEIVSSSGETTLLAGSYVILPARPNNPQSPVASDKPTVVLQSDSGGAGASFEFDKLPDGGLKLYHSARHVSFTMKKDPTWQPAPTNVKVIACTGNTVDAKITLDQAQNRRGTLQITRKASADRHDPPSVTTALTKNEGSGVPNYVYFEGSNGEQDYYVNMIRADFERGSGPVTLHLQWAEGGQQWGVGLTCAFKP
jgi:hypothetical protein